MPRLPAGSLLLAAVLLLATAGSRGAAAPDPPAAPARPELVLQTGHGMLVNAVLFSPEGHTVVSGAWDSTVKLWDSETGELRRTLEEASLPVSCLAVSADGRVLASGGGLPRLRDDPETPGQVRLWNAQTGAPLAEIPPLPHPVRKIAVSPDGATVAALTYAVDPPAPGAGGGRPLEDPTHDEVHLWDTRTGKPGAVLTPPGFRIACVAFTPDGRSLVLGGMVEAVAKAPGLARPDRRPAADGEVRFCDPRTGTQQCRIAVPDAPVSGLSFDATGKLLATAHGEAGVRLWNAASGELLKSVKDERLAAYEIALAPDGKSVAVLNAAGRSSIERWDLETGRLVRTFLVAHPGTFNQAVSLALSPDGKRLAGGGGFLTNGSLTCWDFESGKVQHTSEAAESITDALVVSRSGKLLACNVSSSELGEAGATAVLLWDLAAGRLLHTLWDPKVQVHALAFSPDGSKLAAGAVNGAVRIYDTVQGKQLRLLPGNGDWVHALAFSPDGALLAGLGSEALCVWSLRDSKPARVLKPVEVPDPNALAFSPDGTQLICTGGRPDPAYGGIQVFNVSTGRSRWKLETDKYAPIPIAFLPGGQVAVGCSDGKARIWEAATGKLLRTLGGPTQALSALSTQPGGSLVAAAFDGQLWQWSLATGQGSLLAPAGKGSLRAAFTADGRRVVSAGVGTRLHIDSASSGKPLGALRVLSLAPKLLPALPWIASTPEGYYAGTPTAEAFIRWRVGDRLYPAARYRETYRLPERVRQALTGMVPAP